MLFSVRDVVALIPILRIMHLFSFSVSPIPASLLDPKVVTELFIYELPSLEAEFISVWKYRDQDIWYS